MNSMLWRRLKVLEGPSAISGAVVVRAGESYEQAIARAGFPENVVLIPAKAETSLPVTKSLAMKASSADD